MNIKEANMDIHIDTKKDSLDEIKRAIRMLQAYANESERPGSGQQYGGYAETQDDSQPTDIFGSNNSYQRTESTNSEPTTSAFNMFGDDSTPSTPSNSYDSPKEDEDKEEKIPRVQIIDF